MGAWSVWVADDFREFLVDREDVDGGPQGRYMNPHLSTDIERGASAISHLTSETTVASTEGGFI